MRKLIPFLLRFEFRLIAFCLLWPIIVMTIPQMWPYVGFKMNLLPLGIILSFSVCVGLLSFWVTKTLFLNQKQPRSVLLVAIALPILAIGQFSLLSFSCGPMRPELIETVNVNDRQYHLVRQISMMGADFTVYRCEFFNIYCPVLDNKSLWGYKRSLLPKGFDEYRDTVDLEVVPSTGKLTVIYHNQFVFAFDRSAPPE